jgi:hypothetical protein
MSAAPHPSPFDPDQALSLAYGKPEIRDRVLAGALTFLAPDGEVAPLLDSESFRVDPAARGELAHRALGLARQAGMLELAQLFRELTDALDTERFADAERIGRALPEALQRARAAVAAQETGRR